MASLSASATVLPTQIPPPPGQSHMFPPVSPVAGPSGGMGTRPPSIRFSHVCATTEQLDASAAERYVNDDSV